MKYMFSGDTENEVLDKAKIFVIELSVEYDIEASITGGPYPRPNGRWGVVVTIEDDLGWDWVSLRDDIQKGNFIG